MFGAGEALFDAVVIIGDFQRAEIEFAHVRGGERVFPTAFAALKRLHETSRVYPYISLLISAQFRGNKKAPSH